MLWFARASVGLPGVLGKILVALKNYFPVQFSLILGICIPVPGLCMLHIFGDSGGLRVLRAPGKKNM